MDAEGWVLGLEFVDADDFHRYLATHGGVLEIPEQVEDGMLRGVPAPGARLESSSAEELRDRYVSFAKDFYGSTLDQAKGQLENDRSELEGLLEQLPEDQEEARAHIQELLDSFDSIVSVLDEAAQQGQPEITSAAAQRAQELGVDLPQIEGSGANSSITLKDVMGAQQ